jgi:serine/threonine protein kinase
MSESMSTGAWESTVARDVLLGQQLGDFVVTRRIGVGGMGIVYEGVHPVIGRKVAIKILRPELTEGVNARDLAAEARAASAIRHRGIIDVFGFGTLPGIGQYLVMEYLEGTPLNELISKKAPLAEAEAIALLDELLAALAAAHAVGVIHRDLKPGNVFVARDSGGTESVKVLDFGLAKRSEVPHGSTPQTRASLIVGTPEYIAPEQANGQEVGPHTDLYAAGLIAYELLTRRLPFEGTSPMAIILQHVQKEPPAPSSFVELHPRLDALVLRMLAKEPSQRPASAQEVRSELRAILALISQGEASSRLPPASSASLPRAAEAQAGEMPATMVRATPQAPLSARKPRSQPLSQPISGVQRPGAEPPALSGPVSVPAVAAPQASPPGSASRLGVSVGVAVAVVLACLGGWVLRGKASSPDAPPPTAPVPAPAAEVPVASPLPVPVVSPPVAPAPAAVPVPTVPEPPAAPKKGWVHLVMRGTGTIWVDKKRLGEVPPLNTLLLTEGPHQLEILNSNARPYRTNITILAGQHQELSVTLKALKKP